MYGEYGQRDGDEEEDEAGEPEAPAEPALGLALLGSPGLPDLEDHVVGQEQGDVDGADDQDRRGETHSSSFPQTRHEEVGHQAEVEDEEDDSEEESPAIETAPTAPEGLFEDGGEEVAEMALGVGVVVAVDGDIEEEAEVEDTEDCVEDGLALGGGDVEGAGLEGQGQDEHVHGRVGVGGDVRVAELVHLDR